MASQDVDDLYEDGAGDEYEAAPKSALERARAEHEARMNPNVENLNDLAAVFLRVEDAIRSQTLGHERLLRTMQRGAAANFTSSGAAVYPITVPLEFKGTLEEMQRQVSRREWTAIDRLCVLPEMAAEQLAELFPNNEVLVAGAFITYVNSTFPCKLGFEFHQFKDLPRNETGGARKRYHFTIPARMKFEGKHTLMNNDDPAAERLMREHPEYTPGNIDKPNFGVIYDETTPNKKNLKSDHPAITFAALALGKMGTPEALKAQAEMLEAAENFSYVQMDKAQADLALAAAKARWQEMMKVTCATSLTTARIDRLGYKFDSVEGLVPDGADTIASLLSRAMSPLNTTAAASAANTASALNGAAVLRTAAKQGGSGITSGASSASTTAISTEVLSAADAYNVMLQQPYSLSMKVEFLLRSPKGSSFKNQQ